MHSEKLLCMRAVDDASSYRVDDDHFLELFWLSCHALWMTNISRIHLMHPKFMAGYCSFRRWAEMMMMMPFTMSPNAPVQNKTGRCKLPIMQTWKMYCNISIVRISCNMHWLQLAYAISWEANEESKVHDRETFWMDLEFHAATLPHNTTDSFQNARSFFPSNSTCIAVTAAADSIYCLQFASTFL